MSARGLVFLRSLFERNVNYKIVKARQVTPPYVLLIILRRRTHVLVCKASLFSTHSAVEPVPDSLLFSWRDSRSITAKSPSSSSPFTRLLRLAALPRFLFHNRLSSYTIRPPPSPFYSPHFSSPSNHSPQSSPFSSFLSLPCFLPLLAPVLVPKTNGKP